MRILKKGAMFGNQGPFDDNKIKNTCHSGLDPETAFVLAQSMVCLRLKKII